MAADTVLFTPTLAEAFDRVGLPFPGEPEPGRMLRFSTNERDRTDRAGWLKLLPDAAGAAFGCWRAGLSYCWQRRDTNAPPPSSEERIQARQRAEEARQQAEQERAEGYATAAHECAGLWATLAPAPAAHEYLQRKGIAPHLARVDPSGKLTLPVFDARGDMQSLQFIAADGAKRFYPGGKMVGGRLYLGTPSDGTPLVLVEGFATGSSIREAAGLAVVVGFAGSNLRHVAEPLRRLFPNSPILVAGDLDAHGAGRKYAEQAADAGAPALLALPRFRDGRPAGDFNDLTSDEGPEEVRRQILAALRPPSRFKVLTAEELDAIPPMKWLVRGVVPVAGVGAIFGPSGCGKSFLTLDMLAAIAAGREWFGCRVKAAPVLYVALEGEAGIRQRKDAYQERHGSIPATMRFMLTALDIRNDSDRADLVSAIKSAGLADGVLVLDTLNRAASGMDENSSSDMGDVIDALKDIQRAIGGVVLAVHHSGKDVSKGMRGHSSLIGALDTVVEVSRNEDLREWKSHKVKDGEDGIAHPFRLDVVEIGVDEDGEDITSCVVEPTDAPADTVRAAKIPGGGNMRIAWDRLGELLRQSSHFGKASAPITRPCIELEVATADISDRLTCDQKRRRERTQAAITGLVARGLMVHEGGWLWTK